MSRYAKFITAVVGAVATWATATFPADASVQKWVGLAVAIATALAVFQVPNKPTDDRGNVDVLTLALVALIVVVILVLLNVV